MSTSEPVSIAWKIRERRREAKNSLDHTCQGEEGEGRGGNKKMFYTINNDLSTVSIKKTYLSVFSLKLSLRLGYALQCSRLVQDGGSLSRGL